MAGRPCGSPDRVEQQQVLIQQQHGWADMADRCDATNGEASGLADPVGISAAKLCAKRGFRVRLVHTVGA